MPKQLIAHGINREKISLKDNVLEYVIDRYTRESGVRLLEKVLSKLIRNVAKSIAMNESFYDSPNKKYRRNFRSSKI